MPSLRSRSRDQSLDRPPCHFADRGRIDAWTAQVSGTSRPSAEAAVVQQAAIGSRYTLASASPPAVRPAGRLIGIEVWDHRRDGNVGGLWRRGDPFRYTGNVDRRARGHEGGRSGEHGFALAEIWPRSIDSTHASMESLCRRIDEEALAEADRLRLRSNLNRLRTSSIVRSSCRYHCHRARIIADRRGWRQPSAVACREVEHRWAFRSRLRPTWRSTTMISRTHEDRRDVAGAGRGACC